MGCQGGGSVIATITDRALEWFPIIMSLEMDLQMIASREGTSAMLAFVSLVTGMQFDVPISASFVLELSITKIAYKFAHRV